MPARRAPRAFPPLLRLLLLLVVAAAAAAATAEHDASWEMEAAALEVDDRAEDAPDANATEARDAEACASREDGEDLGLTIEDADAIADEEKEEQQQQEDIPFEDITGNLTVVKPLNGSETEGSAVAVQLNVNTNCINVTRFQEKYNSSNICISLDDADFACWPIFGLSRFPLYTNLTEGAHRLVAKLVDPETGEELIDESVAESTFFMVPVNETAAAANAAQEAAEDDEDAEDVDDAADEADEADEDKQPETETISIPQVGIEFPAQEFAVPGTFEVRLHIVTSANLTQFRRLFQNSFICLALDAAVHQVCWPIFEENYYPKFFNLKPGAHSLVAHLSHPNTLEIIPGTAMEVRNFWVTEKNQGMIPMTLRAPSESSNAFSEELRTQAEGPPDSEVQAQAQVEGQHSPGDAHGTFESAKPKGPHVSLQINVDGQRHVLVALEGEDPVTKAGQFCVERNIIGQNCVSSISRLIEIEWQKLRDIPHIELFSQT